MNELSETPQVRSCEEAHGRAREPLAPVAQINSPV
jgi:hypothetical protein